MFLLISCAVRLADEKDERCHHSSQRYDQTEHKYLSVHKVLMNLSYLQAGVSCLRYGLLIYSAECKLFHVIVKGLCVH